MKRALGILFVLTAGSVAHADIPSLDNGPESPFIEPAVRPQATYRMDPAIRGVPRELAASSAGFSNVIYLNNCKPNGCQVTPASINDSRANPPRSTIPDQPSVVQPFAYSDATWNQVVDCVRKTYAPFDVEIVTTRPTSGDYHMAIVAGRPQDVQMQSGVGGVSPYTCGYISNAISYSFANVYGGNVDDICWTVAQETAHSWGLDHKFDNRDPMTYLESGPSRKAFQNSMGACGEYEARGCQCGGTQMNSFTEILQTFGGSTPTPPQVAITAPTEGQIVTAEFPIRANIMDDISINKAELYIDNQLVSTRTSAPYVWNAPATLGQGRHKVKVVGYDISNTTTTVEVNVVLGMACTKPADCDSDTDTCVDGRCVPGSGVQGGLGSTCADNTQCASGNCASDAEMNRYCVEECDPVANACPSGFDCVATGAAGVCWPGAEEEGGCSSNTGAPGFLLLGFVALLAARRRR